MPKAKALAVAAARTLLGLTLVLSGFVKAIDPLGTQYKLQDYAVALGVQDYTPDWLTLAASVAMSAFELTLGVCLTLAVCRRAASRLALLFMTVMTITTVWIYIANPVQDCGCFGDAIHLTNGETLLKNLVLLAMAGAVARCGQTGGARLAAADQWLVAQGAVAISVALSLWCLYDLPLLDFRPYRVGANIREGMTVPKDAPQPEFETTFTMEKNGERREFSLDDYPDSTWTFIDSRTVTIKEGYTPPIHDFQITTVADGEDITDEVLADTAATCLLISPALEAADDQNFGDIDRLYELCQDRGLRFLCLTASGTEAIRRWQGLTGAEYPFATTDATTLKTMIRSNPGLMVVKGATVVAKWSHNRLPDDEPFINAINTKPQ